MQENEIIAEDVNDKQNEAAEDQPQEKTYSQKELDELLGAERAEFEKRLAEAQKLAALSDAERSDYKRGLIEKQLAEREAAVAKRELMADAAEMLAQAGLPKELAGCLNYSGRQECEESLSFVRAAFENALTSAVNERVRGYVPKRSSVSSKDAFLDGLGM